MAFPIIPKKRSGSAGNPASLQLGELATNTATGELFLGGDGGVMLLNAPSTAGTTVTEHTGDGTTVAFTFTGYSSTDDGAYLVSVGGIDQPPSKYSISSTAGGTLTFVEAPVSGELISIRAIIASSGGGGGGDATSIQGVDVSTTTPTNGQVLAYNSASDQWEPTSLNGSVTFNSAGTHQWAVPAWARWLFVNASSGNGSDGFATNGADGEVGIQGFYNLPPTTGANGANGTSGAGTAGKSITIAAVSLELAGGAAGLEGLPGFGGGGSGGGTAEDFGYSAANGTQGSGPFVGGYGGEGAINAGSNGGGGAAGGGDATSGSSGADGGAGGTGALGGGNGGSGGSSGFSTGNGGGGGGGNDRCGGGGGGGSCMFSSQIGQSGTPGKGGIADISMCAGGAGNSFADPVNFSAVAGTTIPIVISEGAGNASITISW